MPVSTDKETNNCSKDDVAIEAERMKSCSDSTPERRLSKSGSFSHTSELDMRRKQFADSSYPDQRKNSRTSSNSDEELQQSTEKETKGSDDQEAEQLPLQKATSLHDVPTSQQEDLQNNPDVRKAVQAQFEQWKAEFMKQQLGTVLTEAKDKPESLTEVYPHSNPSSVTNSLLT